MNGAPRAPVDPLTGVSAAKFGVYVHFPYCLSKCPYCDFASVVAKQIPGERYAHAVLSELLLRLAERPASAAQSVFFGGGTPSLWEPVWVGRVLQEIRDRVGLEEGSEVTLEANPDAADIERFAQLRDVGVNRLSIGVQSFNARTLAALGRAHNGEGARRAFRRARQAGFENVSMDFIYGVQGQTLEEALADAREAVGLNPEHLSAYALTLDPEALAEEVPLAKKRARGELVLPPDEVVVSMAREVEQVFARGGLHQYEISNYARPGYHSRHNCLYWTGGEYLALGVGATGCFYRGEQGVRYSNLRSPEAYLNAVEQGELPEASRETLSRRERFSERLAMGLRLSSGVDLGQVCREFGESSEARAPKVNHLVQHGFAMFQGSRLRLTQQGSFLHSEICAQLL